MRILTVGLNPTLQRTLQVASVLSNGVNRATTTRLDVAGKAANAARVLGQIGDDVVHLCHAGGRNRGRWLELCADDGLNVVAPEAPGDVRTCVTILDTEERTTTEFVGPAAAVDERTGVAVWDAFRELIDAQDAVLFAGSMAPGFPEDLYLRMMRVAGEGGPRVALDLHGGLLRLAVKGNPDLIKINVREFASTFTPELKKEMAELESQGLSLLNLPAARVKVERSLRRLAEDGITVVLSQGAQPTLVLDPEHETLTGIPAVPLDPVNTIGCGDTMTA